VSPLPYLFLRRCRSYARSGQLRDLQYLVPFSAPSLPCLSLSFLFLPPARPVGTSRLATHALREKFLSSPSGRRSSPLLESFSILSRVPLSGLVGFVFQPGAFAVSSRQSWMLGSGYLSFAGSLTNLFSTPELAYLTSQPHTRPIEFFSI